MVYLSLSGGLGLWYQLPLLVLGRGRGLQVVVHQHSYAYVSRHSPVMALVTRVLRRSDRHLFLSDAMRAAFAARYRGRAAASVLSNAWFVESPDDEAVPPPERGLRLVHVSNLSAAKGTAAALEAAALVSGAVLTLVGPCVEPPVAAAVCAAGPRVR